MELNHLKSYLHPAIFDIYRAKREKGSECRRKALFASRELKLNPLTSLRPATRTLDKREEQYGTKARQEAKDCQHSFDHLSKQPRDVAAPPSKPMRVDDCPCSPLDVKGVYNM